MNLQLLYMQRYIRVYVAEGNLYLLNGDGSSQSLMEETELNEVWLIK